MSCNGCRVLRKGCSEGCVLRHCLRCIDSPEAQAHATLFVTKFFGRAGLTGFINSVPENQRPALFQSLLYEACGRTVNPVYGAVGLLFSGKWAVCQDAVETVLRGGSPKPAAFDASINDIKPILTESALKDHPAGSISTLDPPAGLKTTTSAALIDDVKHLRHPPALESSLATSASSFKVSSLHAAENHCVLDFSNYSTSSSADKMIARSQHLNKRPQDSEPETTTEEGPMLKKARSSILNGSPAATTAADPRDAVHGSGRLTSIMAWIEGNKSNCRRIGSNDCMISYDVYAPAGRDDQVVLGSEIKHAASHGSGLVNASNRSAVQGNHHDPQLLVAPMARRVYIPQPVMTSKSKGSNSIERFEGGDHYQPQPCMRSGRKEGPSWSDSAHPDAMADHARGVDAIDIKLNLGLQAQHRELCCDHGELVNNNSAHEAQDLIIKHEEPQVLLRMSSPSVNSEGSVNTLVGGLDRSSYTANFESPKNGLKLLNLLL